jgi:hypothetical protein
MAIRLIPTEKGAPDVSLRNLDTKIWISLIRTKVSTWTNDEMNS